MKPLHLLAMCVLLLPVLTLATGSALAQEQRRTPPERSQGTPPPHSQQQGVPPHAKQQGMPAHARGQGTAQGTLLASTPVNAFHGNELIGSKLKSRADAASIGTVRDLVIDENGRVVAVITDVGRNMGMGRKRIAIPWSSVDRVANERGDGFDYFVNTTRDAIKDAPEYQRN